MSNSEQNTSTQASIAMWALEPKRQDLIEAWFGSMQQNIKNIRSKVHALTYGGVEGDIMPIDILSEIDKLRKQAYYMYYLATFTFELRQPKWDIDFSEQIKVTATRCISEMKVDLEAIAIDHALICEVCISVDNKIQKESP